MCLSCGAAVKALSLEPPPSSSVLNMDCSSNRTVSFLHNPSSHIPPQPVESRSWRIWSSAPRGSSKEVLGVWSRWGELPSFETEIYLNNKPMYPVLHMRWLSWSSHTLWVCYSPAWHKGGVQLPVSTSVTSLFHLTCLLLLLINYSWWQKLWETGERCKGNGFADLFKIKR